MPEIFKDKAFDVEHALVMYARSYVTMPAFGIYEDELLAPLLDQIRHCHIYIVGMTPKLDLVGVAQEGCDLITSLEVGGNRYRMVWPMPEGLTLRGDGTAGWYIEDLAGEALFPDKLMIAQRLTSEHAAFDCKVLYIGQAYGDDGSRHALDRLKKHETLQKIAVKGIPEGYNLTILMLAIEPGNQLITMFNPFANDKRQGSDRIKKGLDKLFGTNEAERTTLYEASLIRYFQPQFNKEFKNSFPSTNLKVLADCYEKDIAAVVAEICIDELPFRLFSDAVHPRPYHIAKHDLHTDEARRVFFT
ncbi:hypothetical protein [Phenylobacterium sp.]|uniref:hypothetical protein n=1 Tax=Phenylobacterium sp. TaxID=1871053 RepID=UPI004036DE6B